MSEASKFREYAESCFKIAQAATDEAERARWMSMAQKWLQWAQDAEKMLGSSTPD
jgi:hypothetical protein